eukprot:6916292-Pyramimonas_sp.AAC.1
MPSMPETFDGGIACRASSRSLSSSEGSFSTRANSLAWAKTRLARASPNSLGPHRRSRVDLMAIMGDAASRVYP